MKENQANTLVGDELLIAVFKEFPKDQNLYFKCDIMLAFYRASKLPTFKDLFENYPYDEDGPMPFSKGIAEGLSILRRSALLCTIMPEQRFNFSKGIDHRFDKFLAMSLSEVEKIRLKKLAEEIKGHLL
jgi:hypothetical protein